MGPAGQPAVGVQIKGVKMLAPIGTKQMWDQIDAAKRAAELPQPLQADIELIRKHLRDYRRFVQSKAVDDEIKRLIGE